MKFQEFSRLTITEILRAHNEAEQKRRAAAARKSARFGLIDWALIAGGLTVIGICLYINC